MADRTIAALYVEASGVYSGLDDVEVWDVKRDARLYSGPHPVVAHPPCERWGRYWSGGPNASYRRTLGDDGGCFAAALLAVRTWGGVLEHPEASHAWRAHGLIRPLRGGGWSVAGDSVGWTCCVEQGAYGHEARKATWLYAVRCELPRLRWRAKGRFRRLDAGNASTEQGRRRRETNGVVESRLGRKAKVTTPLEFRDILLELARSATGGR